MKRRNRILIVDDNPRNLLILDKVLREDYETLTVSSGEEALQRVEAFRPDLILLDVMMPGLDGYETCRRIRCRRDLGRPKIIIVSARAMLRERLRGYEVGADDYVVKPFNQDELVAKIRVYLELKSVQEIDDIRRRLLTILRHETQTPMASILGAVELLQQGQATEEDHRSMLNIIASATSQLSRLVDRTVLLSRLRAGEVRLHPEPTTLFSLLDAAIASRTRLAKVSRVYLRLSKSKDVQLEIDRRFSEYVIGAILDDMITASEAGQEIQIEAGHTDRGASIQLQDKARKRPISSDSLVFEPFSVTDVNHHQRGDGLALAIARDWVLVNGGQLDLESDEFGTRFTIQLPDRQACGAGDEGAEDAADGEAEPDADAVGPDDELDLLDRTREGC